MVSELLLRALELCGEREQWSSLLRGPLGQLSFRNAFPFATPVDLLPQCRYTDIAEDKMDVTYQVIVACIAVIPRVVRYRRWYVGIPTAFKRVKEGWKHQMQVRGYCGRTMYLLCTTPH